LNGLYQWGGGQTLVVKTHDGKVEGFLSNASGCGLERSRPVLAGQWEGSVLVGQVVLCQLGPGCRPGNYAFMGFYNSPDGTLTADLDLEGSCDVPALVDGRLVLEPVATEGMSAVSLVNSERRRIGPHTARGQKYLHENNPKGAMQEFTRALEHREDALAAYHGMGQVQANQRRWNQAVHYYHQALQIRTDPFVYYNLACAYARLLDRRNAMASLKLAIQNGFASDQDLASDEDLLSLLGKDEEFHEMIARLQAKNSESGSRNSDPNP
jgi:tetratricopeptide (TPR) repeat protein